MFKRKFRLNQKVRNWDKQINTDPHFEIKTKTNGLLYNRFGIIVAKRIDKRAVVRNRLRRTIRGCIEKVFHKIKEGYDILLIVKRMPGEESIICPSLLNILQKEGFIK